MLVLPNFASFIPADIYEVVFNDIGLTVRVEAKPHGVTVRFPNTIGFRLLDEGDLLEFWSDPEYQPGGWIFEVQNGGWLALEETRTGFLSADRKGLTEFFVATANGCLSVLAFGPPTLVSSAT